MNRTELLNIKTKLFNNLNVTAKVHLSTKLVLPETYAKKFQTNIKRMLTRYKSSNMTKTVSKLLEMDKISLTFNTTGTTIDKAKIMSKNTKLFEIQINAGLHQLSLSESDFVSKFYPEYKNISNIRATNNLRYTTSLIDELKEREETLFNAIVESLDYNKIIYTVYQYYLTFLLRVSFIQSKKLRYEIPEYLLLSFQILIVDMLRNINFKIDNNDKKAMLKLIIYYVFFTQYSTESNSKIMRLIKSTSENTVEPQVFDKFYELVHPVIQNKEQRGLDALSPMLEASNIINIGYSALEAVFDKLYGEEILDSFTNGMYSFARTIMASEDITLPRQLEAISSTLKQKVFNAKKYEQA